MRKDWKIIFYYVSLEVCFLLLHLVNIDDPVMRTHDLKGGFQVLLKEL